MQVGNTVSKGRGRLVKETKEVTGSKINSILTCQQLLAFLEEEILEGDNKGVINKTPNNNSKQLFLLTNLLKVFKYQGYRISINQDRSISSKMLIKNTSNLMVTAVRYSQTIQGTRLESKATKTLVLLSSYNTSIRVEKVA